jgi:hypothetical protein
MTDKRIAKIPGLADYVKSREIEIRRFNNNSIWLVMYKAVRRVSCFSARPWSDEYQPVEVPYKIGTMVVAPILSRDKHEDCAAGLHVTTYLEAKAWICDRSGPPWAGRADSILEVLVPVTSRNICIPSMTKHAGQPRQDIDKSKIRCKRLYVNRFVSTKI